MEPLFADEKRRMYEFKTLMEPVLHLGPYCLTESLCDNGFFTAPASRKYHGNYAGGLFDHSFHVTNTLLRLTEDCGLFWQRKESPYIVGMFHDLCKSDLYRHPEVVQPMRVNGQELRTVDVTEWEFNQTIQAVEHALGFKLFVWQKAFINRGEFRQMGATTAKILRELLNVSGEPIDYSRPPTSKREQFHREELRRIKYKLDEAGIPTRPVWFSERDKHYWLHR